MISENDIARVVKAISSPPTPAQVQAIHAWGEQRLADLGPAVAYDRRPIDRVAGRTDKDGLVAYIGAVAGAVNTAADKDGRALASLLQLAYDLSLPGAISGFVDGSSGEILSESAAAAADAAAKAGAKLLSGTGTLITIAVGFGIAVAVLSVMKE